ncbi:hypothetical protein MIND_00035000 [Mycena indigotica]|uniref:Uncharacterized protein n=1 Tax=Mycena indigotica TaxID=2126181 RepID=A0A8H6TEE1_9AGAR|nr:uncharacterized protein MIND_00035000 [Mycena indigotica]KAF7315206.1 hypothetical protein MIND_00035000 [Mycena indigotica]
MTSNSANRPKQPPRTVIFANFPSLKVIEPPKGTFSTRNDQWCLTYCSQNVAGRIHNRGPWCRSVCIRKVFSHEVRNVIQFKSHKEIGADGKARYPLPSEGQPINLPSYLGGKQIEDPEHGRKSPGDVKYWDEGWYFWKSTTFLGAHDIISRLPLNLESQTRQEEIRIAKRKVWQDYQAFLRAGRPKSEENRWIGPVVPTNVGPDVSSQALLVPLPLDTEPLLQPIHHLLEPTRHSLELLQENWNDGHFRKFGQRVWEKSLSGEPYALVSRAYNFAYEQWKNKDNNDDDDTEKET